MKSKYVRYYVEGDDEKKFLDVLKTKLGIIKPGKVEKLNVVQEEITEMRLRPLLNGTMVVLVFDTDAGQMEILEHNLTKLRKCSAVSEIVTIPQVTNLEEELVRSCDIKNIVDLLNSKSVTSFKSDLKRISNLDTKLREHKFDINVFWSKKPTSPYQRIENQAAKIKLSKK